MRSEFDIIRRHFTRPVNNAVLGVGDDGALIAAAPDRELVIAVDTLVANQHFFESSDPRKLGHKVLAVNLSDMAAMGAIPRWATLALTLPNYLAHKNEIWLKEFAEGFYTLAQDYQVELIGGDTTQGPLNITVQIIGEVERGKALLRSGAKVGDDIWISGLLGDAALALAHEQRSFLLKPEEYNQCMPALYTPVARVELGRRLINIANSAIDISDGLIADLGHILENSQVAATIKFNDIACSNSLKKYLRHPLAVNCLLAGGDDYELCFTASRSKRNKIQDISLNLGILLSRIGKVKPGKGLTILDKEGKEILVEKTGYDHFSA